MNDATKTRDRKRAGLTPLTPMRAERLAVGATLAEVAIASGIGSCRLSIIERDPSLARPEEIAAHNRAVNEIAGRRKAAA